MKIAYTTTHLELTNHIRVILRNSPLVGFNKNSLKPLFKPQLLARLEFKMIGLGFSFIDVLFYLKNQSQEASALAKRLLEELDYQKEVQLDARTIFCIKCFADEFGYEELKAEYEKYFGDFSKNVRKEHFNGDITKTEALDATIAAQFMTPLTSAIYAYNKPLVKHILQNPQTYKDWLETKYILGRDSNIREYILSPILIAEETGHQEIITWIKDSIIHFSEQYISYIKGEIAKISRHLRDEKAPFAISSKSLIDACMPAQFICESNLLAEAGTLGITFSQSDYEEVIKSALGSHNFNFFSKIFESYKIALKGEAYSSNIFPLLVQAMSTFPEDAFIEYIVKVYLQTDIPLPHELIQRFFNLLPLEKIVKVIKNTWEHQHLWRFKRNIIENPTFLCELLLRIDQSNLGLIQDLTLHAAKYLRMDYFTAVKIANKIIDVQSSVKSIFQTLDAANSLEERIVISKTHKLIEINKCLKLISFFTHYYKTDLANMKFEKNKNILHLFASLVLSSLPDDPDAKFLDQFIFGHPHLLMMLDENRRTPFHYAAISGNAHFLTFITNTTFINAEDYNGFTALNYAAIHQNIKVRDMLLNMGARDDSARPQKQELILWYCKQIYSSGKAVDLVLPQRHIAIPQRIAHAGAIANPGPLNVAIPQPMAHAGPIANLGPLNMATPQPMAPVDPLANPAPLNMVAPQPTVLVDAFSNPLPLNTQLGELQLPLPPDVQQLLRHFAPIFLPLPQNQLQDIMREVEDPEKEIVPPVVPPVVNPAPEVEFHNIPNNTHIPSVEQSVAKSIMALMNHYGDPTPDEIQDTFDEIKDFILAKVDALRRNLELHVQIFFTEMNKLSAMDRYTHEIENQFNLYQADPQQHEDRIFKEEITKIPLYKILVLVWKAGNDISPDVSKSDSVLTEKDTIARLDVILDRFRRNIRGGNIDEKTGVDDRCIDYPICDSGQINNLTEALEGLHLLINILRTAKTVKANVTEEAHKAACEFFKNEIEPITLLIIMAKNSPTKAEEDLLAQFHEKVRKHVQESLQPNIRAGLLTEVTLTEILDNLIYVDYGKNYFTDYATKISQEYFRNYKDLQTELLTLFNKTDLSEEESRLVKRYHHDLRNHLEQYFDKYLVSTANPEGILQSHTLKLILENSHTIKYKQVKDPNNNNDENVLGKRKAEGKEEEPESSSKSPLAEAGFFKKRRQEEPESVPQDQMEISKDQSDLNNNQ